MASTFHVYFGPNGLAAPAPAVRSVSAADCFAALEEGFDDFLAMPTYPVFIGLFYGVAGIAIAAFSSLGDAVHLIFPLAAGSSYDATWFKTRSRPSRERREVC